MTAISEAFAKHGVLPRDAELDIAIAKYLNSGGTIEQGIARFRLAAKRMPGMGQTQPASDGHMGRAQTRQPVEGGGAAQIVSHGRLQDASPPSSNRDREGHGIVAGNGQSFRALPVREPTPGQRTAALAVAKVASISVMDTLKIDGRAIGDWTVAEAKRRGHDKTRDGYILICAARVVANAAGNALLRDVVKVSELQRITQRAMEVADAV